MMDINKNGISVFASAVSDRSYYLRLADNSLVMIDIGCVDLTNKFADYKAFFEAYLAELQSVCQSDVITVAALIITHPHDDHMNFLEYIMKSEMKEKFRFKKIIRSFPPKTWVPQNNWEKPDYPTNMENLLHTIEGAEVITPKRGDIFNFGGAEFEILLTAEDAPGDAKDLNYFSMMLRQRVGDTTLLWTGDMSDSLSQKAIDLYGESLKCDILQVPHHGTPNGGKLEFYRLCNADVHLWTIAEQTFLDPDYMFAYGKYIIPTEVYNMKVKNIFCRGEEPTEIKL